MIKKINLSKFKLHKESEIHFEESLSVLVGENNSGKTSLLESLLILQECYNNTLHKIIRSNSSKVKQNILRVGNYDFQERFIGKFESVRSQNYYELFYKDSDKFNIEITFQIQESETLTIGFSVAKGRNETAYLITPKISDSDLMKLNRLDPSFFMTSVKSSPISIITRNEPFYTPKLLEKYILESSNLSVMRNRLLKLKNENKLLEIQDQIKYIFDFREFELDVDYNMNKDLYIKANFKTDTMDDYQDIALLGSGTLQIMEILISLNLEDKYKVKVALLDEPDSHLHRRLQQRLLGKLREISKNGIQIILTTHNEQIVSSAFPSEILHLYLPHSTSKMSVKPLQSNYRNKRTIGFLQNINKQILYNALGANFSVMNYLEAVESDRVVLVEGYKDAIYVEALDSRRRRLFPVNKKNKVAFWSLNGIDDLINKLKYWKDILENLSNEINVWSKAILLLDRDALSLDEINELSKEIKKHFNIEVLFWQSYTIETILLEEVEGFIATFAKLFSVDRDKVKEEVNKYLSHIKIEDYKNKIEGQRKAREQNFDILKNEKLKLNTGLNFHRYMQNLENTPNKIAYLFGKDEILKMINELIQCFGIPKIQDPEDVILEMFLNYDGNYWQTYWTTILNKIYG